MIDRLLVKQGIAARLEQSVSTALKLASGLGNDSIVGGKDHVFSEKLACPDCGISVPILEPRSFSFNSPYGACPACNGLGSKYDFDPARVIVDWTRPLFDGGLGPGSGSANLKRTLELAATLTDSIWKRHSRSCPLRFKASCSMAILRLMKSLTIPRALRQEGKRRKGFSFLGSFEVSGTQFRRVELGFLP